MTAAKDVPPDEGAPPAGGGPTRADQKDPATSREHAVGRLSSILRNLARVGLAVLLLFTGRAHLFSPDSFMAQVPPWFPAPEATILISGLIELSLALALLVARERRPLVGWVVASFFVIVFPGNISQFVTGTDAFGLDTDAKRFLRLLLQPVLIVWALWCTGAWRTWRARRHQ